MTKRSWARRFMTLLLSATLVIFSAAVFFSGGRSVMTPQQQSSLWSLAAFSALCSALAVAIAAFRARR